MEQLQYKYIKGWCQDFDSYSCKIKNAETGEISLLRLSERKAVDVLTYARSDAEPWIFAHSPDMVLMFCGPAAMIENIATIPPKN